MNRANTAGSIALGDVSSRVEWLVVACGKCDRKDRVRLSSLVQRYGPDYPMTHLRLDLAADCPRLRPDTQMYDQCDAHFPKLSKIMDRKPGEGAGV